MKIDEQEPKKDEYGDTVISKGRNRPDTNFSVIGWLKSKLMS